MRRLERTTSAERWPFVAVVIALLVTAAMLGCSQYDGQAGSSVVGGEVEGVIRDTVLYPTTISTWVQGDIEKPVSSSIFLGEQDGMHSDILIRFYDAEYWVDTLLSIDSVQIVMYNYSFVDSEKVTDWTPFSARVYRIDEEYEDEEIRYDYPFITTELGSALIGTADWNDSVLISLDTNTVRMWDEDSLRWGVLLRVDPGSATFLKRFYGSYVSADSLEPILKIYGTYEEDGEVYSDTTIRVTAELTTYLTDDIDLSADEDYVFMSNGYIRRALFLTDLSSLSPTAASINRAELFIYPDTMHAHDLGDPGIFTFFQVTEAWDTYEDSLGLYSWNGGSDTVPIDTNVVRIDFTRLARYWERNSELNFGLSVSPSNEGTLMGRVAFYNSNAADSTLRPWIRVVYTDYSE